MTSLVVLDVQIEKRTSQLPKQSERPRLKLKPQLLAFAKEQGPAGTYFPPLLCCTERSNIMASPASAPILAVQDEEFIFIELTQELIARLAYETWESDGKIDGTDHHYWFHAIAELHAGADPDEDDEEDDAAVSSQGWARFSGRMSLRPGIGHS
jgi:hypothetical protein